MIQRVLASKGLVASVLASGTGLTLFFGCPFPVHNLVLRLIALCQPIIYEGLRYSYTLFLFTSPYIAYCLFRSGFSVFASRRTCKLKALELPKYPNACQRNELYLVLGEVHDPRPPVPAEQAYWRVPERGLPTGIAIFGAIGTGKTSGCMYPYAEPLIADKAQDPDKRIGGLVLEVKGDFSRKVGEILSQHGRAEDCVEVKRQAGYSYNPPYDDLDACALAYNIASLLNAINQAFRLMNARPVWRNNQSLQASDQTIGSSLRLRLHVRFDKEEKAEVVTNCDHAKNLRFSPSYRSPTMAPSSQQRDATLSGRLPSATGKLGRLARLLVLDTPVGFTGLLRGDYGKVGHI